MMTKQEEATMSKNLWFTKIKLSFTKMLGIKKMPPESVMPLEEVVCVSYAKNEFKSPIQPNSDNHSSKPYEPAKIIKPSHELYLLQCSFWSYEMLIYNIFQTSVYFILGIPRTLMAFYNTTFGHSIPTEKDVLNLLFNSSMILYVQQSRFEENTYILDCDFDPENEKTTSGRTIKSMKMTFEIPKNRDNTENATITEFLIDDVRTRDPQVMMGAMTYYIWVFAHTKIHSASAPLLQKIKSDSIQELKPSLHGTRAINKTLYSSIFSPLNKLMPFHFPISKECGLHSATNFKGLHHSGIILFKDIPYCKFLLQARSSCFKHLSETGLSAAHCEYFFLHTILHSMEHNIPGKFQAFKCSLWIGNTSWWNCFRSELFRLTVCVPTVNPFWTNLFSSFPASSVYGKIYSDMAMINKEWADMLNASVLY